MDCRYIAYIYLFEMRPGRSTHEDKNGRKRRNNPVSTDISRNHNEIILLFLFI